MANGSTLAADDSATIGGIETPRLRLETMDAGVLEAFARGEPDHAARLLRVRLGECCDLSTELARLRLSQLRRDATLKQWLLRAVVRQADSTMIGHIGFHTAPNPEYLRALAPNAVEIGYSIYEPYRRNGYATEAVTGLLEWAAGTKAVGRFVASVSPSNAASLGLLNKLAGQYKVSKIGVYDDPDDGPEEIFLLLRTSARSSALSRRSACEKGSANR